MPANHRPTLLRRSIGGRREILFHIANVSRISAQAPNPDFAPDPAIFGSEPAHTWCYYFEKADLARQYSDWQTILKLQTEANQKGYTPTNDAEYLPFIEANVQTGNWQTAIDLSQETIQSNDKLKAWSAIIGSVFQIREFPGDRI